MLRAVLSKLSNVSRYQVATLCSTRTRPMSHSTETDEEFDAKWEAYFKREDIDDWELRFGMNKLYGMDLVPEPKIIIAALQACRKLDDYAMTVRILEMMKDKSAGDQEIYNYIVQECRPTMDELGLSTPEELGLSK